MSFQPKDQEQRSLNWEDVCKNALMAEWSGQQDSAHDLAHVIRVMNNALSIQREEGGDLDVIKAAIWLHDLVNLPKDHPQRAEASSMSAEKAARILSQCTDFPQSKIDAVKHAIHAHSFSANIETKTLEAKIVQDADRLDALGAIGTARCFAVSGALGRALLDLNDPLCESRKADDTQYAVDHFFVKLFKLPDTMKTKTARIIANNRVAFMRDFLQQLKQEQIFKQS